MKNIAVTCEMGYMSNPQKAKVMCNTDYLDFVKLAGASPYIVSEGMNPDNIADSMDGLLLTGGKDISPLLYGEDLEYNGATNCNIVRDMFEKRLYNEFLARNKPVFGICRGFQLIGIFNKLRMSQDIHKYKEVHIQHSQGAKEICGTNPVHSMECRGVVKQLMGSVVGINSFHHQGFMMMDKTHVHSWIRSHPEVIGWSRSNDKGKILEALMLRKVDENDVVTLIGGVQYHPERMIRAKNDVSKHTALFEYTMGMMDDEIYEQYIEDDEQQVELQEQKQPL